MPLELDQVYRSVDDMAKALGPAGRKRGGAAARDALHALAQLADGNGTDVHTAITTIAAALPALTAHPDQLKKLIDGIDQLTSTLAAHNSDDQLVVRQPEPGHERARRTSGGSRRSAIANLQSGLAEVATFIRQNQDAHRRVGRATWPPRSPR